MSRRSIGLNMVAGHVEVSVWAPLANTVALETEAGKIIPLELREHGHWQATTDAIGVGEHYLFVIDGHKKLPDPASLSQPDGVHGPSQHIDINAFEWTDGDWTNPPLSDYIFYELHTGVFSTESDFKGIINKLDYLAELGITAIEIMPVAQFPGERNWGYDGVFPFAVQNSYGGAAGLQQLVDACHKNGLAVVLDVVYNHLGPEGNYLSQYGPYFTEKYKTPWGNAVNFDDAWCDGVRHFFIENALMWFRDFHIDALRLDAVHAIKDFSPKHILREIKERTDQLSGETGKRYHLVVECDLNDPRYIDPLKKGGYGIDAQWTDEFHHALRLSAGQQRYGYYSDFSGVADLAKAYRDAYVYTGQFSEQRHKKFGVAASNPGDQFIVFSQNHDQVGNRMLGERTSALVSFEMQKLLAGAVMVSPFLPLLFMGEEWTVSSPFQYFVSHTDKELIKAVQKGRREEFKEFHAEGEAPDPQSEETFHRSKLNWDEVANEPHRTMVNYYKALISLRKNSPVLKSNDRKNLKADADEQNKTLVLRRWSKDQQVLCLMNFSGERQAVTVNDAKKKWQKVFDSSEAQWGGPANEPGSIMVGGEFIVQPESIIIYTCDHV
ncbi:MAG TPA: malto-oligosyltrehalose trehalohydrolase [Mucilaginibacter sp.]|nr:malto-oligosyltrehalose trehalohydrolase [Mucilaginibacter sp.]